MCNYLINYIPDEEDSEDYIYDDLPHLKNGCNVTRFSSAEGSDGEYSELPFNSDTSRNDPSNEDKNRLTCRLCSRYFRNF